MKGIDWSAVEEAAKKMAGNWQSFDSFAWRRGYDLEDADKWCIWYTSHRTAAFSQRVTRRQSILASKCLPKAMTLTWFLKAIRIGRWVTSTALVYAMPR
jgi:hypothetical protein